MEVEHPQDESFQTIPDMDLIEILWRQDIDMGVSKETFNISLRKELEKEQELEIKKEEEKAEASPEEQTTTDTLQLSDLEADNVTFIIDVETGELVPAPPGTILPDSEPQPMDTDQNVGDREELFEDALRIMQAEANSPVGATQPVNNTVSPIMNDIINSNEIDSLVEDMAQLNGLTFSRQASLENRWQDVEGLITTETIPNRVSMATRINNNITMENTTDGALIQNATLAAPVQPTALNLSDPIPTPNTDILPLNLNESQMLFNLSGEMPALFPNASVSDAPTDPSALLSDLLGDVNELNNMTFPSRVDTNSTAAGFQPIKYEDTDSALGSLGSPSSLQEYGDSHSNITSPFEGLEGAIGGQPQPESTSAMKYDPGDNMYDSFTTIDWEQAPVHSSNDSSDNDTDLGFTMADPRHVKHNHTYPLQPGQEPKESKTYPSQKSVLEKRSAGHNRDQKRAKAMKIPFSVDDIINTPVETFNEMLSKYRLTESQLQLVKDIRRRGKNKVAAQNCRKRKMEVIETLEQSVHRMRREKDQFTRERNGLERERDKVRDKYNNLYRDVFRSLRDEHGRPYNPNEYTLQHTADGNVFLVPKAANASAEDPELKKGKKRKSHHK